MPVVFPLHPRTRARLTQVPSETVSANFDTLEDSTPGLLIIPPVGYLQMVWLLEHCRLVLTDSGGVQKEAYFFQKPCVTLRDETEWVELIEAGVNTLVGADPARILSASKEMATRSIPQPTLYGDGHSAEKIVESLSGY